MFFRKKKVHDSAKKFDKLITGLIIGGAVASMIGLSKTNKGKEITQNIKKEGTSFGKKAVSVFGKTIAGTVKFFSKK